MTNKQKETYEDTDALRKALNHLKGRKFKLKKWSCGCANIRMGAKDCDAKCLRCGNKFELIS